MGSHGARIVPRENEDPDAATVPSHFRARYRSDLRLFEESDRVLGWRAMADEARTAILDLVARYWATAFAEQPFMPGVSPVPVSGRVFDSDELVTLVDASLDFWLTAGRYAREFESTFAEVLGGTAAVLCNSGSSANLLAVCTLTAAELGERRLRPGDEVITVAAGFPTTVNPIVQQGMVPVFVDVELGTYNIDCERMQDAVGPRTRAVILAHTLGNPFDLARVTELCRAHDLWLIEDNCDALGSTYGGQLTGTFGDLSTFSFYPAHHITMGEGGCVLLNRPRLRKLVESFRDWGRDCWCEPGKDNTCGKRFEWELGDLPDGYDHKYIYSHIGYNLKVTDLQAAIGVAQLRKLPGFIAARRRNWQALRTGLEQFEEFLVLPESLPEADPSWFGFPVTVRPEAPFSRRQLIDHLEEHRIATRNIFAGNLVRQPAFRDVQYRVAGGLDRTDTIMTRSFWVGVYPGLSEVMVDYMIECFTTFLKACGR